MKDYYIKTTDENALWEALIAAGVGKEQSIADPSGENVTVRTTVSPFIALDVIGTIYKETGNTVTVGEREVPETIALEGFHANIRGDLSAEQEAALADVLIEAPTTPVRVWA